MAENQEDIKIQELLMNTKSKRSLTGRAALLVSIIAIAGSLWHMYALGIAATSVILLRNLHVMFGFNDTIAVPRLQQK